MRNATVAVVMIGALTLLFVGSASCAPNRALTRDANGASQRAQNEHAAGEEDGEYTYNYGSEDEAEPRVEQKSRQARPESRRLRSASRQTETAVRDESNIAYDEEASDDERFYQKGQASWYGREFHGKTTASGERFDMNKNTAAHRTLPFGTVLMVKNLDNGKTVEVKVNDRGPFSRGRILDLSYSAAREIGMLKTGEAKVGIKVLRRGSEDERNARPARGRARYEEDDKVEPVAGEDEAPERNTRAEDAQAGSGRDTYSIQAGAFYSRANANTLKKKLQGSFQNPVIIVRDGDMYKVRIESIRSQREANRIKQSLENDNVSSFLIQNRE